MRHPFFDVPRPTVIGHRGAAGEAPENTLASFALALAQGAHILESDVHATRDGVAVLAHDPSLERMTGDQRRISECTLAEVQKLDAAFGFAGPDEDFPERGRGHRIPTLEEAFERFADARFNLEIKAEAPGLVESVFATIGAHGRAERTLLAAEHDAIMRRIHAERARSGLDPALGASVGDVLAFVRAAISGEEPDSEAMALQIPTEFAGRPLVTPELVAHAHRYDVLVHAWTINDPDEMHRLVDIGVDGLVTDFPARMRATFRDELGG